jgi:integrase
MTKHIRNSSLEFSTNRLKLPVSRKPVFVKIGDGVGLGYRRNVTAGTWVVRVPDGSGNYWTKKVGDADDYEKADGVTIFGFFAAQDQARLVARGADTAAITTGTAGTDKPVTVAEALQAYEDEMVAEDGDIENVRKVRSDLSKTLAAKPVSLLTTTEMRAFRNTLAARKVMRRGGKTGGAKIKPSTVNRNTAVFKAALNRAADLDPKRITNRSAWKVGLATLEGGNVARNVIITDAEVIKEIVAECYADPLGTDLGLLADVCAETGTRCSQAERLLISDLTTGKKALLMMPTSHKGTGTKAISHHPTPITSGLASRLAKAAGDRKGNELLLLTHEGKEWGKSTHNRRFAAAAARAGHKGVSIIAFRHSSIVRQLLDGVPTRVVAVNHDTSVAMIEKNYSKYIGSHTEEMTRKTLIDFGTVRRGNVVDLSPGSRR